MSMESRLKKEQNVIFKLKRSNTSVPKSKLRWQSKVTSSLHKQLELEAKNREKANKFFKFYFYFFQSQVGFHIITIHTKETEHDYRATVTNERRRNQFILLQIAMC